MSDRERAREIVGNGLHGTTVSHERRLYLQDAIATALAQARAEGMRQAAEVTSAAAERHREAAAYCAGGDQRDAARFASYTARCVDDVAAAIRALAEGGE